MALIKLNLNDIKNLIKETGDELNVQLYKILTSGIDLSTGQGNKIDFVNVDLDIHGFNFSHTSDKETLICKFFYHAGESKEYISSLVNDLKDTKDKYVTTIPSNMYICTDNSYTVLYNNDTKLYTFWWYKHINKTTAIVVGRIYERE